jgi:phosphohistidine phosphatase
MQTLIVVRHAKAESSHLHERDFDRPLTWQGAEDAKTAAARLVERSPQIPSIVASPSARTRATAEIIAMAYGLQAEAIRFDERIYDASLETLQRIVSEFDALDGTVVLVGHNPGVLELCYVLTSGRVTSMSTSAIVEIPMV